MGFYGDESVHGLWILAPLATLLRPFLDPISAIQPSSGWRAALEIVHSHHLHGGSIRWARQPGNSNLDFALSKTGR